MPPRTLFAVTFTALALSAQSDRPLSFDVASVKLHDMPQGFVRRPWSPNIECPPWHCGIAGDRFTEDVASLADLIMDAYRIRRFQVINLPDWGDSGHDVYDIAAKLPAAPQPATLDQVRRMLQTLLAERFQLKLHHETRDLPAYNLVLARSGSKLTPSPGKPCDNQPGRAGGDPNLPFLTSWDRIPEILGMIADRPVIDKTGYEGHYCTGDGQEALFSLDMRGLMGSGRGRGATAAPTAPPDPDTTAPSLFLQVQQKWGMRLDPQKGPIDVIVIDHVSRPSAN
jgi:uncharacterized protein (TIGR03435 family)